jgi:hypothetical protein
MAPLGPKQEPRFLLWSSGKIGCIFPTKIPKFHIDINRHPIHHEYVFFWPFNCTQRRLPIHPHVLPHWPQHSRSYSTGSAFRPHMYLRDAPLHHKTRGMLTYSDLGPGGIRRPAVRLEHLNSAQDSKELQTSLVLPWAMSKRQYACKIKIQCRWQGEHILSTSDGPRGIDGVEKAGSSRGRFPRVRKGHGHGVAAGSQG